MVMTTFLTKLSAHLMLPQVTTASLEKLINKVLSLDSANVTLSPLSEKTLSLVLTELNFPLSFTVTSSNKSQSILVNTSTEYADCIIHTSLKTLKELKEKQQLTELIKQDKLDVTGDLKIAQQFAALAENLSIDWQSELANFIGDVPTHKLVQTGQNISSKLKFASQQIQADASEYLVHEQALVVCDIQLNTFNESVLETVQKTAELDIRIARLQKQLAESNQ